MADKNDFPWGAVALGALYLSSKNHRGVKEKSVKKRVKERREIEKILNNPSTSWIDRLVLTLFP
jgi:hypothetical protein